MAAMSFRNLALALALSFGVTAVLPAATKKTAVYKAKRFKPKKYKQSKASKVKPRKAPKH